MSGPRILLLVVLAAAGLLWMALVGDPDADLERGLKETGDALALVEQELLELDPLYQKVTRQGLMLNLRQQHDTIRTRLAELKAQRQYVPRDPTLDKRRRLPRLRALRDEIDAVYALAVQLRRQLEARWDFMTAVTPQLETARRQRDELLERLPEHDEGLAALVRSLAGSFTEIEGEVRQADQMLQQNLAQGRVMSQATQRRLRTLVEEQAALLERLRAR